MNRKNKHLQNHSKIYKYNATVLWFSISLLLSLLLPFLCLIHIDYNFKKHALFTAVAWLFTWLSYCADRAEIKRQEQLEKEREKKKRKKKR